MREVFNFSFSNPIVPNILSSKMITLLAGDHTNNTEMFKTPINFFLSKPLDTDLIMTWTNTLIKDKEDN